MGLQQFLDLFSLYPQYRANIHYNSHYSIGVNGNDFAVLVMENHERYLHRGRMFPNGTSVD